MQPRSASRGSQYIRGTRPRDRQQQLQQLPPLHTKHPQDAHDGKRYYSPQQQQQYQAYPGPAAASPEDEEPVYLPSIGNFQSLHSLVNNLPQCDTTTTAPPASTPSTAANPWGENFSFSNGRPLASRTRHLSPVDRPFSVAVGGLSQSQSQSQPSSYAPAPRSSAARPMSTAAARNEPYQHAYSASSDAASIERQAYQAVSAVRRSPGSLLRKESYHAYSAPALTTGPVTAAAAVASTATSASASGSSSCSSSLASVHHIPQPTRRPPPVPVQAPASTQIPSAARSESYHAYSGSSLAASNSSSSLDKQGQPAATSTSASASTSTTARPMSTAPGAPKAYHAYSANPSASASTSSLPQADTAASTRRTLPSAVRSHSYYGTGSPAAAVAGVATNTRASSSTSSLDRQVHQSTAQRSASVADARPRLATSASAAVARRATSNAAALPRPASAVAVRSQSYHTSGTPASSDMARRNTMVFDSDLTRNKNPQPNPPLIPLQHLQAAPAPAPAASPSSSAEQASKQPRFYALLRASMVVPDTVQIATVEEETTAIRQRSIYEPQPRPRSSRRSQWPRASSRLFTGSSMTDITDKDETDAQADVVVESRASMSCPSLVPTSNLASASSTTLSTPKTSGEDYKSQYRKTKSFPLEEASGTTTPTPAEVKTSAPEALPAPTSNPPNPPPMMSRTVTAPAEPQARKLIKRNPSAPKPRPNPRLAQTSRSMSLVGTPRLPTSRPSSPPPLPRAMSVHIPSPATAPGQAADRSKKPRLTSLWSGLFRLRVSS
ncbi:hypothetical protein H105_05411 [Trichophyton soudanense CBS 452.61]|uniref:Uncharacterized protein n=1 Tax=Trichophyton soudanense CBS 452.61 TaxID=1215331 RepID=A0A022XQE6_TRISD|nr:hypothetical protein H105_05411 [Trichophyton soudanense CBS 452.61]